MKYFKRRCNDTRLIFRDLFEQVTWKNFIVSIPAIILFTPIILLLMLFEDYDEIDCLEKKMSEYLGQIDQENR